MRVHVTCVSMWVCTAPHVSAGWLHGAEPLSGTVGDCQLPQACQIGELWGLGGMVELSLRWLRCLLCPAVVA